MTKTIRGPFDVKRTAASGPDDPVGRWLLDKQFHGDLSASSVGQMLAVMTEANGAAVYVALERVTGTLEGRSGTFVLHHLGNASKAGQSLVVGVAADSGTGELAGLKGTMAIVIEAGGKHFYELEYELG